MVAISVKWSVPFSIWESINIEKSAIRIQKDDLDTSLNTPTVCRQCKEMKCLAGEEATAVRKKRNFSGKESGQNAVLSMP